MLDPAIIQALDFSFPPEAPRIVEERLWLTENARRAERLAKIAADGYEAQAGSWLKSLTALEAAFPMIASAGWTEDDRISLEEAIDRAEKLAEYRAVHRARFAKASKRETKRLFAADPSLGAVSRSLTTRLLAIDDRVIDGVLHHALVLRAVRAHFDPAARGGPIFDDPEELARHLDGLLAA